MGAKQPKQTPAELAKENKRTINKSLRHLEREKNKLEREEGKIIGDIKKLAQKGLHVSNQKLIRRAQQRSERRIWRDSEIRLISFTRLTHN